MTDRQNEQVLRRRWGSASLAVRGSLHNRVLLRANTCHAIFENSYVYETTKAGYSNITRHLWWLLRMPHPDQLRWVWEAQL